MKSKLTINIFTMILIALTLAFNGCGGRRHAPAAIYTISGSISGLAGSNLILQNNNADDISISPASTNFTFTSTVASGENYNVTVKTQPSLPTQLCTINNGSGAVGNSNISNVEVHCLSHVSALYPVNGANWNDYVQGSGIGTATDTACNATSDSACLHGGEKRAVSVNGKTSCIGLTASDALNAFNWVCDDSSGIVKLISNGLANNKNLSDLLDFSTLSWKQNSLTVFNNGDMWGQTPSNAWWTNLLVEDNNGMTAFEMNAAGTIYLVTAAASTGNYNMGADRLGLVIKPGVTLKGAGTNGRVIESTSHNFLWIEGSVDATSDSNGVNLGAVKFSVANNILVSNATSFGIYITSSSRNSLTRITASNNGATGIGLTSSSNNRLTQISSVNNLSSGIDLSTSNSNSLSRIYTTNINGNGLGIYSSSNNIFSQIVAVNNVYGINVDSSTNNIFTDATLSNNDNSGILLLASTNNILAGITAANNSSRGIYLTGSSTSNTISRLASLNNSMGLYSSSNSNLFSDNSISANDTGILLNSSFYNIFTGLLKTGNSFDCSINAGTDTDAGLTHGTCANNWLSNALLTTGINISASIVGKVISDSSNANGTTGTYLFDNITDWFSFDNAQRSWGKDGSIFPNTDNRGACVTGQICRIWDWSLQASDTAIHNVLALPTGNDTLTHTWLNSSTTAFLSRALEISGDSIGNDNDLCESGETCLYTPNIGSYQGHGNLISAGAFTNGTLTGITLLKYETNGR